MWVLKIVKTVLDPGVRSVIAAWCYSGYTFFSPLAPTRQILSLMLYTCDRDKPTVTSATTLDTASTETSVPSQPPDTGSKPPAGEEEGKEEEEDENKKNEKEGEEEKEEEEEEERGGLNPWEGLDDTAKICFQVRRMKTCNGLQ